MIKPIRDNVLVKRLETEETSKGGILLTDSSKEKPNKGEVLAVGIGTYTSTGMLIPPCVQVGDMVLFGKFSGKEFTDENGDVLLILKEHEIQAIL